jgi:hypothetical protein
MKPLLSILFVVVLAVGLNAQEGHLITREQIKTQKVAFITQQINLTVEEAQQFWPVYNDYENKKDEIQKKRHEGIKELRHSKGKLAEKDLEKLADLQVNLKMSEAKLAEDFHVKIKKILPIAKVVKFYEAEFRFSNFLLREMRKKMENRSGKVPGGKKEFPNPDDN